LNKFEPEKFQIRLFFGGTELKDDEQIYKYRIKNNNTVQLSKREIIPK